MNDFILSRAKAFMGLLIPAIATAILSAIEGSFGFTLGEEMKVLLVSTFTGAAVYQVPNKQV